MDALADVLRLITLDAAIYFNAELTAPWCLETPQSRELAPMLTSRADHVIVYHLLCEGEALVEIEDVASVSLSAGDSVTMPHGHAHLLRSGANAPRVDAAAALDGVLGQRLDLLRLGGGGARARFICGFLACDLRVSQAFLGGLPPLVRINIRDDASGQWLENSLRFAVQQAASDEAGAKTMLAKLAEAVFAETLRRFVHTLPEGQTGWLAGARDVAIGRALTLLHQRHAHPWTLAELAREAGVSRTVLAERFQHFIGETPMAYLTRWRLGVAARALRTTRDSVAQIAADVGYESEPAFNRAFKREFGVPPARYRRDQAEPAAQQV